MPKFFYSAAFIAALMTGTTGCDVEKTQDGELPSVDVDVDAQAGKLPKFDVDAPDVDVTTEEKEVLVPKVVMEKETIEVPDVDVTIPKDE